MVRRNGLGLLLLLGLLSCATPPKAGPPELPPSGGGKPERVACVGVVEPARGLVRVAAAGLAGKPAIVGRLLVEIGQVVERGQVLAELAAGAELAAAVRQAAARVGLAESRVKQLEAPVTPGALNAARAQVERLKLEREAAEAETARKERLVEKDLAPRVQWDAARVRKQQVEQMLAEAQHRLVALEERRPADVAVAKAEVEAAKADWERARVDLGLATVRAPEAGTVTQILARPGEAVGLAGLLELAPAGPMVVQAEVYESDVARVRVGQRARIEGDSLGSALDGVVGWVSPQIVPRSSPTMDPTSYTEGRVFRVRIDVRQSEALTERIHARVQVWIEP